VAFLAWRAEAIDQVQWRRLTTPVDRARTFALVWFLVVLAGVSALPAINYIFRVRYGIITMVPVSLLLAWVFGLFAEAAAWTRRPSAEGVRSLPAWAVAVGIALLVFQSAMNLSRSITFRRDMGQVMVAVDQAYEYFAKNYAAEKLALFPDFRPYDYRPD